MIRYLGLSFCLGLMGCQSGTASTPVSPAPSPQTACEEHDSEGFKAPPKDNRATPYRGEFDTSPSSASIGFYLTGWSNAPKRVTWGRGSIQSVWQYSWSETEDYCFFHLNYTELRTVFKPDDTPLKPFINSGKLYAARREILQALGREYEVLHGVYLKNGKLNYCSQFRSYRRNEGKYGDLWQNMFSGWLCTSRHRAMPPEALKILLTHITYKTTEMPLPEDIVRMPVPGEALDGLIPDIPEAPSVPLIMVP
jgi:hypothetical protein